MWSASVPQGYLLNKDQILGLKWISVSEKDFKWHQGLWRALRSLQCNPYWLPLHSYQSENSWSFLVEEAKWCFFCIRHYNGQKEVPAKCFNRKMLLLSGKVPAGCEGTMHYLLEAGPKSYNHLVDEDFLRRNKIDTLMLFFRISWLSLYILTKQNKLPWIKG